MITLKNVSVDFKNECAISDFSAEFKSGITALLGVSGSGKTTLLRAIAGLQEFKGEIEGTENKKIAFSFQDYRLFPTISAQENILLAKSDNIDLDKLLQDLKITDFKNKKPHELSGGMKARVSLARALGSDADIVLLDEPFSALNAELKAEIAVNILPYLKDKTVILVTHNPEDLNLLNPQKIINI